MSDLIKQQRSAFGAMFAAACCLGLPLLLSALTAAGHGFLIHDAILIPLLIAFVALNNLWRLWHTTGRHHSRRPFGLGVVRGALAVVGLHVHPTMSAPGLLGLVVASAWDFINGRRAFARAV